MAHPAQGGPEVARGSKKRRRVFHLPQFVTPVALVL